MINNINQSEILCNQVKERGYSDFFILDNEAENSLEIFIKEFNLIKEKEWKLNSSLSNNINPEITDLWIKAGKPYFSRNCMKYLPNQMVWDVFNNKTFFNMASSYFGVDEIWASCTVNFRPKSTLFPWQFVGWHSDRHSWPEHRTIGNEYDFLVVWISMDETDLYGGGLSVIPTDRADGRRLISEKDNQYCTPNDIDNIEKNSEIKLEPKKGECFLFSSYTYHKSISIKRAQPAVWTFDFRFEAEPFVCDRTRKLGVPLYKNISFKEWSKQYLDNVHNFI